MPKRIIIRKRQPRKKRRIDMNSTNKVTVRNTPSGAIVRVPQLGGLTPRFRTNLCYDTTYTRQFDGVSATEITAIFRLNSLFDFDQTNIFGNFQPAGRDRLAALYSFATIRGCKMLIEVAHTRDGGSPAAAPSLELNWVVWQADSGTTVPSPPSFPRMLPTSQTKTVALDEVCRIRSNTDIAKFTGMGGTVFNSGSGVVVGSNPGNPVFGQISLIQNYVTGAVEYNNYSIHIRAIFDVEFSGPKKAPIDTD